MKKTLSDMSFSLPDPLNIKNLPEIYEISEYQIFPYTGPPKRTEKPIPTKPGKPEFEKQNIFIKLGKINPRKITRERPSSQSGQKSIIDDNEVKFCKNENFQAIPIQDNCPEPVKIEKTYISPKELKLLGEDSAKRIKEEFAASDFKDILYSDSNDNQNSDILIIAYFLQNNWFL